MPTKTTRSFLKKKTRRRAKPALTARTADRHELYQQSVQNTEAEIDFVDETFRKLRRRRATLLREDFGGTANTSCEWVRRREENVAVTLDLDADPLGWGLAHNVAKLEPEQAARVRLLRGNVLDPEGARPFPRDDGRPIPRRGFDCVLAMNFSYWCFTTRAEMLAYFKAVRRSLRPDGIFFMDHYGGSDALKEMTETRRWSRFTYIWDQAEFNPITGRMKCYIHFKFPDGSKMERAFEYEWRLWTIPELRDILADAGFKKSTVYWEEDDGKGGGNGVFKPTEKGEADRAYITYIVAEK